VPLRSVCELVEPLRASALIELIERAIEVRVNPAPGSQGKVSFMLEIQRGRIDALVTFGWLPADQQDDLSAIGQSLPPLCRPSARCCAQQWA
jgi:hypothetical protein